MIHWNEIHKRIEDANSIVLTTHVNPDGDGLGSSVAMYYHLVEMKKDCRIFIVTPLPEEYQFLNKNNIISCYDKKTDDTWIQNADLALIFDVGDFKRMKNVGELLSVNDIPMINIDHHPIRENSPFLTNAVDTSVAATGELVYDYFNTVRKNAITMEMWEGLYTAVVTDTGSFAYSNTTIKCHQIAMDAIQAGVNPATIHQRIYESNPIEKLRLLSKILHNVQLDCNGEFAWFTIDEKMMQSVGANKTHVDGFTDMVRSINGVEVAMMIFENEDSCRVNLRSKGKYIVNTIALELGGGGHKLACGAVVRGRLDEVLPRVLELTKSEIAEQNGMKL